MEGGSKRGQQKKVGQWEPASAQRWGSGNAPSVPATLILCPTRGMPHRREHSA